MFKQYANNDLSISNVQVIHDLRLYKINWLVVVLIISKISEFHVRFADNHVVICFYVSYIAVWVLHLYVFVRCSSFQFSYLKKSLNIRTQNALILVMNRHQLEIHRTTRMLITCFQYFSKQLKYRLLNFRNTKIPEKVDFVKLLTMKVKIVSTLYMYTLNIYTIIQVLNFSFFFF